jgi:hypothetical protein
MVRTGAQSRNVDAARHSKARLSLEGTKIEGGTRCTNCISTLQPRDPRRSGQALESIATIVALDFPNASAACVHPRQIFVNASQTIPKWQPPGSHVVTAGAARLFDATDGVLGRRVARNARYEFLDGAERL